jgi:hypothetical protein
MAGLEPTRIGSSFQQTLMDLPPQTRDHGQSPSIAGAIDKILLRGNHDGEISGEFRTRGRARGELCRFRSCCLRL